jgi:hypothetical protein
VADLDLEAGRQCDVEAEHLIVGMLAEAAGDGAARFPRAVEGVADVVAVGDLDHEVVQLLGQVERCPHQCQRVVPRVAVVEADLELDARGDLGLEPVVWRRPNPSVTKRCDASNAVVANTTCPNPVPSVTNPPATTGEAKG